jgi:hypothetical protein
MKEGPESLINAPLYDQVVASLAAEMHHIQWILLVVVHNLSLGLLVAAGLWSLGKLLGLGRGTTRGSTDILTMLQATLITMSHFLQEH